MSVRFTIQMSSLGVRPRSDSQSTFWSQEEPMSQRMRFNVSPNSQASFSLLGATKQLRMRQMRNVKSKKSFNRAVKKAVTSSAEAKCLQLSGSLTVRAISSASTDAFVNNACMCLTPQGATIAAFQTPYMILANGVGQDQRIGDKVAIKATYLDYLIYAKPYDATFNTVPAPQVVTVLIIRPKTANKYGLSPQFIRAGADAILFENQANADSGLGGTLSDILRKIDTDNYSVLARREYKIGYQGNLSSSNTLSTLPNNDFPAYVKDRVKLKGGSWQVNRSEVYEGQTTYALVFSLRADGTAVATSQIPVAFDFNVAVYYTDL